MLLKQIQSKNPAVENTYSRIVSHEGNIHALKMMADVFQPVDSQWRGLGMMPGSGYGLRPAYHKYDALRRFDIDLIAEQDMPKGCSCHRVLIGEISPKECPLFGTRCTPRTPVGPCMVSHEGSCQIAYTFKEIL